MLTLKPTTKTFVSNRVSMKHPHVRCTLKKPTSNYYTLNSNTDLRYYSVFDFDWQRLHSIGRTITKLLRTCREAIMSTFSTKNLCARFFCRKNAHDRFAAGSW